MQRRIPYDPALDGVRSLAVAAVLLYHAEVTWLPGGFLGVDLFFVLSGYLITTLLLREHHDEGHVDLPAFWARRARRLLPALLVMLAWVALYVAWIDPGSRATGARNDALATLLYVANWHDIVQDTGYFAAFSSPSPLLHTWSLAIEEQWYVVWPLAMMGLAGLGRRRLAIGLVGAAVGASALWMAVVVDSADPSRAYYGTDTRAQTLLVGALVALVLFERPVRLERRHRALVGAVTAGCAAGLIAMTMLVSGSDTSMYRGGFLLAAALGAGIVAGVRLCPDGAAAGVLGWGPLPRLGRISYGLYLWHWPVYVLLSESRTGLTGPALTLLRIGVAVGVAVVSYTLVEQPFRQGRPARHTAWSGVGAVALAAVVLLALVPAPPAVPTSVRITAAEAASAPADVDPEVQAGPVPVSGPLAAAVVPGPAAPSLATRVSTEPLGGVWASHPPVVAPGGRITTLVVGDSVMLELVLGYPPKLTDTMIVSSDVLLGCGTVADDTRPQCRDRLTGWMASVAADEPDVVLLALSSWDTGDVEVDGTTLEYGTAAHRAHRDRSWQADVDALTATGARVVVLSIPCLVTFGDPRGIDSIARTSPERTAEVNAAAAAFVAGSSADVAWLDIRPLTCPDGVYSGNIDGVRLHRDGVHYTEEAVPVVWEWLVTELTDLATHPNPVGTMG